MDANLGRIVTFYSYKGGTGRSMALANFAWILAARGKKVLVIDWDLEAPGLHRYFRPFLTDSDLLKTDGLIDSFWEFASSSIPQTTSSRLSTDPKKDEIAAQALDENKRRLNWEFATHGYIDFICAGKQDATYSLRVNTFDWKRFYELGGSRLIALAKAHMRAHYDWVLIDSRTGVSDTSSICTVEMPDTVVACFTLNRQSIEGVRGILASIREFKSSTVDGSKIKLYPLATRIENAEKERLETARGHARTQMAGFLPRPYMDRQRAYWDQMELVYRPSYAFEEVLAAFGDATGAAGSSDTMLAQVEKAAQCITGDDKLQMPEILDQDRVKVLAKYSFVGTAPKQSQSPKAPEAKDASADNDADFLRGVLAKEQVWRAEDFQWQLLLSRRELELIRPEDQRGFGRNMTYFYAQSQKMQNLLGMTPILSLGAAILSLIIGFLIPFFLAPYYPPFANSTSTSSSSSPDYPQATEPSYTNSKRPDSAESGGMTTSAVQSPSSSQVNLPANPSQARAQPKVETGVPFGHWASYLMGHPGYILIRTALSSLLTFCFLCGILALGLSPKTPHGLRTTQLLQLLLAGPFRKDISDYDPKRVPSNVRSTNRL